jgi:hypothetical protein
MKRDSFRSFLYGENSRLDASIPPQNEKKPPALVTHGGLFRFDAADQSLP